jgi:hypothetical protein
LSAANPVELFNEMSGPVTVGQLPEVVRLEGAAMAETGHPIEPPECDPVQEGDVLFWAAFGLCFL